MPYNTQLSAQLDTSRSQARYDRVNAKRHPFLYEQGAASAKRRDAYETKAIQSRDEAVADKSNINYKFVRSPIDGVVGDLDAVKIGDYLKTGDIITDIEDIPTIWTLMEIHASRGSQIKVGQPVQLASHPPHKSLVKAQSPLYRHATPFPKPVTLPTP